MVGIVAGNSLGLSSTSLGVLNGGVHDLQAAVGRGRDFAYVNATTGNLVIQRNDELVMGLGTDTAVLRTYNSQGLLDDDNADNWRIGFYRSLNALTGTLNGAGSSIVRVDADGAQSLYRYDPALQVYVCKDGSGAYDHLKFNLAENTWTWSDGASSTVETYDWTGSTGRLQTQSDSDSHLVTYAYRGNLLASVTNASGDVSYLEYLGSNLTSVKSFYASGQESVLVRYGYDYANRLSEVVVDLSPDDASIADGNTYVTRYTYDGDSHRVSSILQKDGSALYVTYGLVAGKQRVLEATQVVDGKPLTTKYTYKASPDGPASAPAYTAKFNPEALTVMEGKRPTIEFNSEVGMTSIVRTLYGVADDTHLPSAIAALFKAWGPDGSSPGEKEFPLTLTYTVTPELNDSILEDLGHETVPAWDADSSKLSNVIIESRSADLRMGVVNAPGWVAGSLLESLAQAASEPQLKYDAAGNAYAAWVQNNNTYFQKFDVATGAWAAPVAIDGTLTGTPSKLNLSVSANGNVLLTWIQNSSVYARRMISGAWDTATNTIPLLESASGVATNPVGAIADNGRSVVVFSQTDGTRYNLYATVNLGSGWQAKPTAIDDLGAANNNDIGSALIPGVAVDSAFNVSVTWQQRSGTQTTASLLYSRYNGATGVWSNPSSTVFETTTTAVTQSSLVFDAQGNGLAIWLQGTTLLSKTYSAATGQWGSATTLSASAAGIPSLSMSANGNAIAAWTESNNIYAQTFSAGNWSAAGKTLIETAAGVARSPAASINDAGQAVVAFNQMTGTVNNLLAARLDQGAWQAPVALESSPNSIGVAATDVPRVDIDASGNVQAIWLQKSGSETVNSVFGARFEYPSAPYLTVTAGATWESIATAVYGTAHAASALRDLLGNPALTAGARLTGFSSRLSYAQKVSDPLHYVVPHGATWADVALALYGSEAAAPALRLALGNIDLTDGMRLYGLPTTVLKPATSNVTRFTGTLDTTKLIDFYMDTASVPLDDSQLTPAVWEATFTHEALEQSVSAPQLKYDAAGNAYAAWIQNDNLYYKRYDSRMGVWSAPAAMDGNLPGTPGQLDLGVSANGNVILAWVQDGSVFARRSICGVWDGAHNSIASLESAPGVASNPVAAITDDGRSVVVFAQADGSRTNLYSTIHQGSGWLSAPVAIDDLGGAINGDVASTMVPSLAVDSAFNISVVWRQRAGADTTDSLFYSRYDAASGNWSNASSSVFEQSHLPVSETQLAFDAQGNGMVVWLQGSTLHSSVFDALTGQWRASSILSTRASGTPSLSMSGNGKTIVAWTEFGEIFTSQYSNGWGEHGLPTVPGRYRTLGTPSISINDAGQAALSYTSIDGWRETVGVSLLNNGEWQPAGVGVGADVSVKTASSNRPQVVIDPLGNVQVLWVQKSSDEAATSLVGAQYQAACYEVPAGATWSSVALVLYGTSDVADALRTELGNIDLTVGTKLPRFPAYLSFQRQSPTESHYLVPANPAWKAIALELYGAESAADALRQALGDPWLSEGLQLTGLPTEVSWSDPSARGITVKDGDTWESIALAAYGDSAFGAALASAMGNPPLIPGATLLGLPGALPSLTTTRNLSPAIDRVVEAGESWTDIVNSVYGTDDPLAAAQLANFLGNPVLSQGVVLHLPLSIEVFDGDSTSEYRGVHWAVSGSRPFDAYYQLKGNESWEQLAQRLYSRADAPIIDGLKQANPGVDITQAGRLKVPPSATVKLAAPGTPLTEMQVADPNGGVTIYRYDVLGNLKEIVRPHEANSSATEKFYYDVVDFHAEVTH